MSNRDYGGDVVVVQDQKLEKLMTNFSIAYRNQNQKIWRVQIFFGNGRAGRIQAQGVKSNFEARHPGIVAVLVFEEPYFKVRVGEFTNRLDAERLKAQILEEYDKLFIIETYEKN
ncbi:MAG: SPOR domain-containing protein [Bacteroidota bacterium]|nr:SPOR domain-containing protein [Bacteroidota bacterium]